VTPDDPYVAYIRRFFGRWIRVYDLFAQPIGFAYRAAARRAGARRGRRILDICTGTGEMALRCADAGAEVTAIDLTAPMLARAVRKAGRRAIRFCFMDARELAFVDGAFDVAVISFALHDMPRDARVRTLREAARVAREGVVVLDYAFPRREPWRTLVIRLVALYETAYLPDFARQDLDALFRAAGLEVTTVTRPISGFCAVYAARVSAGSAAPVSAG
jgi:ubiquinone/menaquinone biosynthesis C-methylase UbiE